MAHEMARGGPCGRPDGHNGKHRSVAAVARKRAYTQRWCIEHPESRRETDRRKRRRRGVAPFGSLGHLAKMAEAARGDRSSMRRPEIAAKVSATRRSKTAVPSYDGVHKRLAKDRGPATDHTCIDCGGSGEEWSLARDRVDVDRILFSKNGRPYTADSNDYDPRCVACHRAFDGRRRQQTLLAAAA
jgi:hypothetical protein